MSVQRRTMKFLIPLTVESLGRNDLTGRAIVPVYLNPQSMSIQDTKIVNEQLTKGGYVVQYWGEQLAEIQVSGTTGSGGIEAVNILRAVYRNEITQFNNLLLDRAATLEDDFITALEGRSLGSGVSLATVGEGVTSILDSLTGGGISGIIDGAQSAIEEITEAALGITDDNPQKVELIPTVGAFATSMILYWHGEKFQGYFKNFRVDENAATPGHFDYQFTFTVTKRSGERNNFMPWHRSPYDASGEVSTVSTPSEGQRLDELSFPSTQDAITSSQANLADSTNGRNSSITSVFTETQEGSSTDANRVSINRGASIRGS